MLGRVSEHIRELVEVRREEAEGVDLGGDVSEGRLAGGFRRSRVMGAL